MKIYNVWNKTTSIFFEDKEDAVDFAGSHGIACGLDVEEITVIPSSKQPSNLENATDALQCPECEQNGESGMNFCANCGRQLWHR